MKHAITIALRVFQFIIALFMMYAGVATALMPIQAFHGAFDFLYNSRLPLVIIGTLFFLSGAVLFYGKFFKKNRATGYGLLFIYLSFLFAGILNWSSYGFLNGLPNLVACGIVALLYLRWKYHLLYDTFYLKD